MRLRRPALQPSAIGRWLFRAGMQRGGIDRRTLEGREGYVLTPGCDGPQQQVRVEWWTRDRRAFGQQFHQLEQAQAILEQRGYLTTLERGPRPRLVVFGRRARS